MFSEEGDGIINSIVFVDKTLFSTVDYATNRTELIDNIAGIIKNLIEFIGREKNQRSEISDFTTRINEFCFEEMN